MTVTGRNPKARGGDVMPWYWILIIISAIVGPFEAMHALNKARRKREEAERRRREAGERRAEEK